MPLNQPARWKDFRSGMACRLLKSGWTRDEVRARLGHTPNSTALNAYINFLALDRSEPKRRMQERRPWGAREPVVIVGKRSRSDRHDATDDPLAGELARTRQELDELRRTVVAMKQSRPMFRTGG